MAHPEIEWTSEVVERMGAEMEQPIAYVFEFEDGLVRRARSYMDPDRAFQAVGVSR